MNVEKFFKEENIEDYDFTDDVLISRIGTKKKNEKQTKYLMKDTPIIEKYILYKTEKFQIDPDSNSGLLKEIYKVLWDEKILKHCEAKDILYYSDTMTSVQTLINKFYENKCEEEWKKYKKSKIRQKHFSKNVLKEIYENKQKYSDFSHFFVEENEDSKIIFDFIRHYHTLGNYIPVPNGFNIRRSGYYGSHDMWDITLFKIKEFYDHRFNEIESNEIPSSIKDIIELFHVNKDIEATINWLNEFESWENFVDKNYLKEENGYKNYVDKNYKIRELANHKFDSPELGKEEFLSYFEEITKIIKGRALIMKEHYHLKE